MKLLSATSFFFFALLFMLNSCESGKIPQQKKTSLLSTLKSKAYQKSKEKEYDSAIFYSHKLLQASLEKGEIEFVQNAHHKLSRYHYKLEQYDSAIYYSEELYELAAKKNDTANMAKAYYKKGLYYKAIDSFKLSYNNFTDSKNLYLKIGDTIQVGKKLLVIANLQKQQGSFGASQLSAIEGIKYLESTNELVSLSGLYYILAVATKETGRLKVADQRIDQALDLAKDSLSKNKIGIDNIRKFKNTKANIYKELGLYDEAITIYENLLVGKNTDTIETKRVSANLGHTLFLKNRFNKKSDSLLQNSLSYYSLIEKTSELYSVQLKLAQLYSEIDKKQSLKYVNEALKNAEKLENPKSIYEALEVRINQKYQSEDFDRYVKLGKQIEASEEDLNYLYANERFDFDKSEKDKLASQKAKIIAENDATKSQNQVLGLLLILIILIVVTFFIYQKIKRQHKIEKIKTVHVTEARISSKVHDELANDLYKLISQLETTDPEKEVVLDKLDVIYNQARDISKQIQTVETGEGFAEELSNLFRSYQSEEVNVLLKRYNIDIWNGISSHIKITVYRVLQELLTNMKKHSNAVLVVVSIEKNNKQLFIQYIDNGRGFAEEISKNGLQNAENRIHAIEGTLTFDTELHKGCKFSINVPV